MREDLAVLRREKKSKSVVPTGRCEGSSACNGKHLGANKQNVSEKKSFRMDSPNCCNSTGPPSLPPLFLLTGAPTRQTKGTSSKKEQERPGGKTSELVQSECQAD